MENRKIPAQNPFEKLNLDTLSIILCKLPAKDVIKFCVTSKATYDILKEYRFCIRHKNAMKTLENDVGVIEIGDKHCMMYGLDEYCQENNGFNVRVPEELDEFVALCCDNGLVLMRGFDHDHKTVVKLWNPTINKTYTLLRCSSLSVLSMGFGFTTCDDEDCKVIMVLDTCDDNGFVPVHVYRFREGAWFVKMIQFGVTSRLYLSSSITVGGCVFWLAGTTRDDEDDLPIPFELSKLVKFNLSSEEFTFLDFPESWESIPKILVAHEACAMVWTIGFEEVRVWEVEKGVWVSAIEGSLPNGGLIEHVDDYLMGSAFFMNYGEMRWLTISSYQLDYVLEFFLETNKVVVGNRNVCFLARFEETLLVPSRPVFSTSLVEGANSEMVDE